MRGRRSSSSSRRQQQVSKRAAAAAVGAHGDTVSDSSSNSDSDSISNTQQTQRGRSCGHSSSAFRYAGDSFTGDGYTDEAQRRQADAEAAAAALAVQGQFFNFIRYKERHMHVYTAQYTVAAYTQYMIHYQ
jgi:hypothetical protein